MQVKSISRKQSGYIKCFCHFSHIAGEGSDGHTATAKEGDDALPEEGGDVDAGELVDGIVTFGQAKEIGGGFGARNGRKAGLEKTRVFKKT